jgi:hypothetical protein
MTHRLVKAVCGKPDEAVLAFTPDMIAEMAPEVAHQVAIRLASINRTGIGGSLPPWAKRGWRLSSDVEDTKPVDKNAFEALQKFREAVLVLVECPPDKRPSVVTSSLESSSQFDTLVGKYAGLLPVLEPPSNAA